MLAPFKSVNAGFYCAQKRMGDKEMLTCKANLTRGFVQRIMDQRVSKMNKGRVARECYIINAFQQWEGREGDAARDQVCWIIAKFFRASQVCI